MAKLTYKDDIHKELCIFYKDAIYTAYREYYGKKEGHNQFQMWSAVTCLNTLKAGVNRAIEMLDEPEIEREEG